MPVPEFIARLRAKIGTDLLWLPGVTGVVLDDAERVLLVRRVDNGRWALVSGIVEPGEEPAACLVRECLEETGVTVEVLSLAFVNVSAPVTYPNGDQSQYLDLTFLCRHRTGVARVADDEASDVGWFGLGALPEGLSASSAARLEAALAHRADPGRGTRFARPETG
jgi:8-oxo-dGTP pyrophosphatase MutT (NUDIX family)